MTPILALSMCGLEKWLINHQVTVQALTGIFNALLTAALVGTTIVYAIDAHRSRVAAENQASSTRESFEIVKREYEDRIGEGPQIVRHAIESALQSIITWLGQMALAQHHPNRVADPAAMIPAELTSSMGHARRISIDGGNELRMAIDQMRAAQIAIQTLRQSALHGPHVVGSNSTVPTVQILNQAREHLRNALKQIPSDS